MNLLKSFKFLYCGKDRLFFHITLFSYIGIMCLCLNNVFSAMAEELFLPRITFINLSRIGIYLNFILGGMIAFLLFGYEYKMVNGVLNTKDNSLAKFNTFSYSALFKMLPIFVIWTIYIIFAFGVCLLFIKKISMIGFAYLPMAIVLLFLLFLKFLFYEYAQDYKLNKKFLSPLYLLKVTDRYFKDYLIFLVNFVIAMTLPIYFLYKIFLILLEYQTVEVYLILLCFGAYFIYSLFLLHSVGMANIVKSKVVHQ